MKIVPLSELQKQVLLTRTEALAVTHNGKVIGHFYPKPQNQAEIDRLWERWEKALDRAVLESGMDREAFIDALDPSKPFPFESELEI